MMRLPAFHFLAPKTIDETVRLLADSAPSATVVAGGTDLYPNMKRRQTTPKTVIGLQDVGGLAAIREDAAGNLLIGAGSTLTDVQSHPLVQKRYPSLAAAVLTISTPLLRNMGTIGGNICLDTRCHFLNQSHFWRQALGSCMKAEGDICRVALSSPRCLAITSADLPPLLIALGAQIRLIGPHGERLVNLAELYRDDGIHYLAKDPAELLTELILPKLEGVRASYLKLRRRGTFDFPALGVAVAVRLNGNGECEQAHIVLGAVTSSPLEMLEAQTLVGQRLERDVIQGVAEEIQRHARPLHLSDFDHRYRKRMVGLYVTRALTQVAEGAPVV